MTDPILDIRGLTVAFGAARVLHGIDLTVERGEIHGLVGESGSGKSLTALAAMGLLPRGANWEGSAVLDGTDMLAAPDRTRDAMRGRAAGMVFQEPMTALNPVQTIGAQVAEVVALHEGPRGAAERARAALEACGLEGVPPTRYPHELSGGQRQRVVIAMATALAPPLVIADEPTTALDVTTQARILDLLRARVRQGGAGLLLVTHDLAVVSGLADRITVMEAGRVVESGPARPLLRAAHRSGAQPYTRALLAATAHRPRRDPPPPGATLLDVKGAVREHPLPRPHPFAPRKVFRALDGVSLTIRAGEAVGLVGESGSGKTTLARAILGLDPLQSGTVTLAGNPVAPGATPPAVRRRVQAVFQDPYGSFDPRWTVRRLVAEPLHLADHRPTRAERDAAVADALKAVGLDADAMDRHPHAFSGGQRQRLAIARALVLGPDLVVLDEAVSALDVSVRARILDLLAELQSARGLAMLFVTHDLAVVRAITDRVLVMQSGRIVEEGSTERVLGAPEHPYTQTLAAAAPVLHL